MPKIMLNSVEYTGGGGDNSMELTYDEYLALSEEEKNNGTTYYITDINGNGQSFQPVIFSLEEREIGVWIDGKPIYEKTLVNVITQNGSSEFSYAHNIANIDNIINTQATVKLGSGSFYSLNVTRHSAGVECFVLPDATYIKYRNSWFTAIKTSWVTLHYTKTTDQPGSGTWTPQGVPSVHYDGNEKVVGTWFGETLYERVYDFSSSPIYIGTSYSTISTINTTNIDKVVYCCAMHQDGTVYPAIDADPTRESHTHMGLKSFDSHSNIAYVIIRYTKSAS